MDTRRTKRGRGNQKNEGSTKKKAVEKAEEGAEKAVEEERKEGGGEGVAAAEETEEWGGGWWSGVDEEMSWASCWFPFWEVEDVGEAYDALYGDVLLDYDIWGLKAIGGAPNP